VWFFRLSIYFNPENPHRLAIFYAIGEIFNLAILQLRIINNRLNKNV